MRSYQMEIHFFHLISNRSRIPLGLFSPNMTSYPPGSCCSKGLEHEGTTAHGQLSTLKDFEIYTAYSTERSPEKGVLM
jgi:hypothetical protein